MVPAKSQHDRPTKYDGIIVLGHTGTNHGRIKIILHTIRGVVGDVMPVHVVAGHTHNRAYRRLDEMPSSSEAGRFLDTVEFLSFFQLLIHI